MVLYKSSMKIENVYQSQNRPVEEALIQNEEQKTFERKYWRLLNRLTPKEYMILALCLSGINNGQHLADDLGETRSEISRVKKNIVRKLRKI